MGLDYAQLHGLTASELIAALIRDRYHTSGETFRRKTLKAIMEMQANWTEGDLKRLRLIK